MSNDIDDITKALAKKYSGIDLAPTPAPTQAPVRSASSYSAPPAKSPAGSGPKLWPMEKVGLHDRPQVVIPKRKPVLIAQFSDEELEFMFKTPAKRNWSFETWLEVVGLPVDLHEKLDHTIYRHAARAYLDRKKEAHNR